MSSGGADRDAVENMSIGELRRFLERRNVDYSAAIEKSELRELAANALREEERSAETSESLANFMAITGADPETAEHYLDMVGGDLEMALGVFMDTGGSSSGGPDPPAAAASASASAAAEQGFPGGSRPNAALGDMGFGADFLGGPRGPGWPSERPTAADMPMDEAGVRAAIPQYREQLVGGAGQPMAAAAAATAAMMEHGMGGLERDEDPEEWMFPAPSDLNFPAPFAAARQAAKEQKRWLLVNLQDAELFASHELNRDTWVNETVRELLRSGFIFWQRGLRQREGRLYRERYKVAEGALPHIAILDPRTGAKVVELQGYVHPEELISVIMDFLGAHSFESSKALRTRTVEGESHRPLTEGKAAADEAGGGAELADAAAGLPGPPAGAAGESEEAEAKSGVAERRAVPPEPPIGPDVTRLRFQMPAGAKLNRRFPQGATIGDVRFFLQEHVAAGGGAAQVLELNTTFPRRKYEDDTQTLVDAGLHPQAVLYVTASAEAGA